MARKRGVTVSPERKKKRTTNSRPMTPANENLKQEKSVLNDGLLALYKRDLVEKKDKYSSDLEEANSENKPKANNLENLKTPSREKKKKNNAPVAQFSSTTFDDVGGMDNILKEVLHMFLHYKVPSLFTELGMSPVRGILLHGPPGCGKSYLAKAIAGELEVPIIEVAATELVCGISGESESKIRDAFDSAVATGRCIFFIDEIEAICPKRETTDNGMMRRMVSQMLKCLDDLHVKDTNANVMVIAATNIPDSLDPALRRGLRFDRELAIGIPNEEARRKILEILCKKIKLSSDLDLHWLAHNTPGYVGADLQTLVNLATAIGYSRICKQLIELGPTSLTDKTSDALLPTDGSSIPTPSEGGSSIPTPSEGGSSIPTPSEGGSSIPTPSEGGSSIPTPSEGGSSIPTPSEGGSSVPTPSEDGDKPTPLNMETLEAERMWFKSLNLPEEVAKSFHFTVEDFQKSLQKCVPFSKREGFASVPDTTWNDIGALEDIKKELRSTIMWPVQFSKFYEENNLSSTKGILLYGPKGCGKTLLAKAIANECSINFLSVNGPELLSMYVGESEKAVRKCFERARNSAPCVIFFDEFDALCPPRSSSKENAPIERVVNQLLTETCGMQERKQVFLVAATNRLEKIDSAMLRPGRLEKILYVGLPTPAGRAEILKSLTKNKTRPKIAEDLNLETIATDSRCEDFSGADLAYLVREATTKAMEEMIESNTTLNNLELNLRHFDKALEVVKPSFSEQDRKYFQKSSSHHSRT